MSISPSISTVSLSLASVRGASATPAKWYVEGLRLLEQREQEDKAKIEWLRAAAKDGFDDIERGHYITLRSDKEIDDFIDQLGKEASDEFAA